MSVRNNHSVEATESGMEISGLISPTGEPVSSPSLASDVPPITRTLVASIRASLSELSQETSSAKWAPSEGALKSIFKQKRFTSLDGSAEAQGDLQSVVLHDLTLKHAKSSFPTSVGAHIFGVDASAFASSGEAFSAVLAPKSDRAYERSLQKDPVQMAYSFSTKFPGYTSTNLETKGVHKVDMKRFVLITADHPIVSAIQENSEKLQLGDVASMPEGLIKVSSSLFDALLPMVQQQVASQIRVRDFSGASISIAPAEHSSWGAVRESQVAERLAPLRRQLKLDLAAAQDDEAQKDIRAAFTLQQAAIEHDVDYTKHEINLEVQVQYNFLSNTSAAELS